MKILLMILFPIFSYAQRDTAISFSEVIKVDSATKEQLYVRARDWFNNTFKNSKEVLQIADKEIGEIAGKGVFKTYYEHKTLGVENGYEQVFRFKITIWVKEGKYKYQFSDFNNYYSGNSYGSGYILGFLYAADTCYCSYSPYNKKKTNELYLNTKNKAIKIINGFITDLKNTMNKKSESDF